MTDITPQTIVETVTMSSEYEFSNRSGVRFELQQDEDTKVEEIVISIPTYLLKQARKPYQAKPIEQPDGTAVYEIPKSESFVYEAKDLRSGHRIALQITRKVKPEIRKALYDETVASGLKVFELEAEPEQKPPVTVRAKKASSRRIVNL